MWLKPEYNANKHLFRQSRFYINTVRSDVFFCFVFFVVFFLLSIISRVSIGMFKSADADILSSRLKNLRWVILTFLTLRKFRNPVTVDDLLMPPM